MTPIPEPLACLAGIMSTFRPRWYLCRGWAVDSWLGRQTRDHADLDFAVFQDDQHTLFDHLAGWQLIGHDDNVADDSSEPWDGRRLDLPAHIHARSDDGVHLDIQVNERSGRDWIFSREPRITLPLRRCAQQSPWGLPTAGPEVILFYKANPPRWRDGLRPALRRRDERDFLALLPHLTEEQRSWLRDAISLVHPGHPWLPQNSL